MKPALNFPVVLLVLLFPSLLWSQGNPNSDKGNLAGINSHLGKYDDYMKRYGKLFYENLYLSEASIVEYLRLKHHPVKAKRKCLVGPEKRVGITFLNEKVTLGWIEQEEAEPIPNERIIYSQATYPLSNDQFLVQFYDNSSVLVKSEEDLHALNRVRFMRLGPRHVSWQVTLNPEELQILLNQTQSDPVKITVQDRVEPFQIYQLPEEYYVYEPDPETEENGQLFENKLGLVEYIHEDGSYRAEAIKYLLNQFLDGAVPPELYQYPFHLKKIQLEEVVLNHDGTLSKSLSDSVSDVYELIEGPVLYYDTRYELARLFDRKKDLAAYREEMGTTIQDPEWAFHNQLNEYGKKLPYEAPELINRLTSLLNIPPRVLDLSEQSLAELDEAIAWNYHGQMEASLVLPLYAYLGETLRKKLGGDWKMAFDDQTETWQAIIHDRSGKQHPIPTEAFIQMLEPYGQAPSLRILAAMEVME